MSPALEGRFLTTVPQGKSQPLVIFNLLVVCGTEKVFFLNKFIYLFNLFWLHWVFVAARGLFSSCGERGLLFVVVHGLIAVASLVAEHEL